MKEIVTESVRNQMRKGVLEFCTLLIIEKDKVYASDILRGLQHADLLMVEGTLYPLLSRLKTQGILEYSWEESPSGPPRKYYSLTTNGKENLADLKEKWKELNKSIDSLL